MKGIFVSFFMFLMVGCASLEANGPEYADAPKPILNDETSLVYFYRTDQIPNFMGQKDIFVNGKKLLSMPNGGYTWIQVDQDMLDISVETPWSLRPLYEPYNPPKLTLNLDKGQIYYVNYNVNISVLGVGTEVTLVGGLPIATQSINSQTTEQLLLKERADAWPIITFHNFESPKL